MSNLTQVIDGRTISVDVEAISRKLYVGDGLKPNAEFKLICEEGTEVVFLGRDRDKKDKGAIPLEVSGVKVHRNTPLSAEDGVHVSGKVSPETGDSLWGEELHFPFAVKPIPLGQDPSNPEYRLAIAKNGNVDKVTLDLVPPSSQNVHYRVTPGLWTFIFTSRHPWFMPLLKVLPVEGRSIKLKKSDDSKMIAKIEAVIGNWSSSKKVASLAWSTSEIGHRGSANTNIFESGGTESVDIYVDPDDG